MRARHGVPLVLVTGVLAFAGLTGPAIASAPSTTPPSTVDRSTVDLRALEKQVAQVINDVRSGPSDTKSDLESLLASSTPGSGPASPEFGSTVSIAVPASRDGAIDSFPVYRSFLESAIAQAGKTPVLNELVWSEGLHKTALDYAGLNPIGHTADGTVETRADRNGYAVSTVGVGEGISYNGPTGTSHVTGLYIDSGVAGVGHRMAIINPAYTHVGVGCFYKNRYDDITCVVNYAVNWVEKTDAARFEPGRTFALRDPKDPSSFRFVSLESQQPGQAIFTDCPGPDGGRHPIPQTLWGLVTSVDTALAGGLIATNKPCALPPGLLANGGTLPTTPFSGGLTLNTSLPQWQPPAAPPPIQVGQMYALVTKAGSKEFQYAVYQGRDARGLHVVAVCPVGTGTVSFSSLSILSAPDTAVADGLKPTNQPCGTGPPSSATTTPAGPGQPTSTSVPTSITSAGAIPTATPALVIGQEYAYLNHPRSGQFTTWIYDGAEDRDARLKRCPELQETGWTPPSNLASVDAATKAGLQLQGRSCAGAPALVNPEVNKTYALRDNPAKGQFQYVTVTSVNAGGRSIVTFCAPSRGSGDVATYKLVTETAATSYWGLRAANGSCGTAG